MNNQPLPTDAVIYLPETGQTIPANSGGKHSAIPPKIDVSLTV
jgi:hypothetical protein